MNRELVDRIVRAVLYEGYILYPYRPSVKNQQRWTFGGVVPHAYAERHTGDSSEMKTECLVRGDARARISVQVRFLHLTERTGDAGDIWQEGQEREVTIRTSTLAELSEESSWNFNFRGWREFRPVIRRQESVRGTIHLVARVVQPGIWKLTVRIHNETPISEAECFARDEVMMYSLCSTHTILGVEAGGGGEFISLMDPPADCKQAAAACKNVGTWPILVGEKPARDTMLSSPIILYDYPEIAPQRPGDLYDATEIDEILTLRILTLTDDEKRHAKELDEHSASLMSRTESLARDQLSRLHGTMRHVSTETFERKGRDVGSF